MTETGKYQFKYGCIGGTFDRLHEGHKLLISVAFKLIKKVLIGITTDSFAKKGKKIPELIWMYEKRAKDVCDYLESKGINKNRYEIKPLIKATQFADEIPELEVIVLSPETYGKLLEINDIRRKKGLEELIAIAIPYSRDENGKIISSQTFRELELKLKQQIKMKDDDAKL